MWNFLIFIHINELCPALSISIAAFRYVIASMAVIGRLEIVGSATVAAYLAHSTGTSRGRVNISGAI